MTSSVRLAATGTSCMVLWFAVGCIQAPKEIIINTDVGLGSGRRPIDTSRLPSVDSLEEAQQKLAEAYARIRYLEEEVEDLEEDLDELEEERDEYKEKYKREKDRHDD